MNIGRSVVKMFGAQLVKSASSFVGIVLFARFLGAEQLGVYFLFEATVRTLKLPTDAGFRGALEKRISEGVALPEFLASAVVWKSLLLAVISTGLYVFRGPVTSYIGIGNVGYVVAGLLFAEVFNTVVQLLRGKLNVSRSADLIALRQFLWVAFGVVAVWMVGLGAIGLVYAYVLSLIVAAAVGLAFTSVEVGRPSLRASRSLFEYAKYDVIAGSGAKVFNWLDVLLIGFFLTNADVGAYETAWRLSVAAATFGMAIRTTIFPQYSSWSEAEDEDRISESLTPMVTGSLFLVIPSFVGTLLLSDELLRYTFGSEFAVASTALVVLMGYRIIQALDQTVGRTLQALDRNDLAALSTVVGVVLNVTLNVFLIVDFGIEGAAVATFLSYAVTTALRAYYLSRQIAVRLSFGDIGWCVVAAAVMGLLLYVPRKLFGIDSFIELIAVVIFGAAIYVVTALLSGSLRSKLRDGIRY